MHFAITALFFTSYYGHINFENRKLKDVTNKVDNEEKCRLHIIRKSEKGILSFRQDDDSQYLVVLACKLLK